MRRSNETLRAFYARTHKSQNRNTLRYRDNWRNTELHQLRSKTTLSIEDVQNLDRFGRFSIVVKRFKDCDSQCQQYLMEDEHHYVRAAASQRYIQQGGVA